MNVILLLNKRKKISILFLSVVTLSFLFYDVLIYKINEILSSSGYSSYSAIKALRLLDGSGDIESVSSGRFSIYQIALNNITVNPILGAPLNSALADTGLSYYHNIILDILVSFGFIVFIGFSLFIIKSFIDMIKSNDIVLKWVYCILFMLSFGRLMVSSVFWQRPEFWLFISFCMINFKYLKERE